MSRCFPFPPPGYERKTKADDTDLLKKEKHREKKHKKEKKDKEKKEGKEKREKERSEEKHREKKDKKEKHRDKKKDKEKNQDKDKHKNDLLLSDEKVVGSADNHVHKPSADSHVHNSADSHVYKPSVDNHVHKPSADSYVHKPSADSHVHKPSADNHVHKPSEKIKERGNDSFATSSEKRTSSLPMVHNGMPVSKNNHQIPENKNFIAPDLGRKSMDEERRTTNKLPDKNVSAEKKKDGGVVKLAAKTGGSLQERVKEKPALDGRVDGQGFIGNAKSSGCTLVPNSVGAVQNKVGGTLRHSEKKIEQKVDGKEKVQEKEGEGRKRDKRKEKDGEKPVHKDMEKEEKKEEIMKATTEEKQIQVMRMKNGSESHMLKPNAKDGNKKNLSGIQSVGFHNTLNDSNHHAVTVNNNLRKRKDVGVNGIYDELVTGPNKMARTRAFPHSFSENGRSLETCQNFAASSAPGIPQPSMDIKVDHNLSYDTQKPPMKIKVDGKDCKINGKVASPCAQPSREHTAKAEQKSDAPAKPPHPDAKYLDQVLSVPKMDEWSEFEDQDWLFSCNSSSTRKPEVKSSVNDETPQVWARALWLEPVDVYALPYVIPH